MTPHARINTLLDRTSQTYSGGNICYMIADGGIWHDYYVDQGGKSWLDPFEKETAAYLADITKEIASAGFTDVILANTRYPAFNQLDYTNCGSSTFPTKPRVLKRCGTSFPHARRLRGIPESQLK